MRDRRFDQPPHLENGVTSGISPLPQAEGMATQPININEDDSVNYWVKALGCSELELRVAVAEVGSIAGDVGSQLGKIL